MYYVWIVSVERDLQQHSFWTYEEMYDVSVMAKHGSLHELFQNAATFELQN